MVFTRTAPLGLPNSSSAVAVSVSGAPVPRTGWPAGFSGVDDQL
ncbi:hypothetical protein ACFWZA_15640 [[Kitasatospora] papulosa]